ncbi:guanyl-specific ribonuclease Sa [Saccharomonospora marina XMU15]|uniref:Guanyl-specific ribonuclease Sa n=1 Tax=Saccharomonospora marina XMU15 TaxID=882083 RepID=H5WZC7_9PSEU|nr:ribonuclease domain-containing protein [Saccharomonospora marina]EHR49589.1 guanyl-specific ribonuclease Sa [Saccharomonospora marina XMU15]
MTNHSARIVAILLAFLATFVAGGANVAATELSPSAECGDTSSFEQVPLRELPEQAAETYELIEAGGPFPYPQDGGTFYNREGLLPDCDTGYYHEYTVETPGSPDRGARRIVTGDAGEYFYTADHYASFVLIDVS